MLVHNSRSLFARRAPATDAMSKTPPSADDYRKRAAAIGKRLGRKGERKSGLELVSQLRLPK